ncbi:MAG: hypothetical protein IPO27_03090 [Bacteroidetes bacterium]|nr:hypothetical protein [Bacteroidota bacterium]
MFNKISKLALAIMLTSYTYQANGQWSVTGNCPTGTQFLGTTCFQDLRIRTNNVQQAVLNTSGNLGIGTLFSATSPTVRLHVANGGANAGVLMTPNASGVISAQNNGNAV